MGTTEEQIRMKAEEVMKMFGELIDLICYKLEYLEDEIAECAKRE